MGLFGFLTKDYLYDMYIRLYDIYDLVQMVYRLELPWLQTTKFDSSMSALILQLIYPLLLTANILNMHVT
jgi:hypothetical protein